MPVYGKRIICKDKAFTISVYRKPTLKFIHILTAFYHLCLSLVLFMYSLIDPWEYAQVDLNYTLN